MIFWRLVAIWLGIGLAAFVLMCPPHRSGIGWGPVAQYAEVDYARMWGYLGLIAVAVWATSFTLRRSYWSKES